MGLETGTTILDLNAAWPLGSDPKSQGDDHLRLIKSILQSDAVSIADGDYVKASGDTMSGDLSIDAAKPALWLFETDQGADLGKWKITGVGGAFDISATDDAGNDLVGTLRFVRDATGVTDFRIEKVDPLNVPNDNSIINRAAGDARYGVTTVHAPDSTGSYRIIGDTLECWGRAMPTGSDISVTFPQTFAAEPVVTLTPETVTANDDRIASAYFANGQGVTTTGFTARSKFTSASSDGNNAAPVHWRAIGQVA